MNIPSSNTSLLGGEMQAEIIPFFDQSASFIKSWPELQQRLHEVFDVGKFSHGKMVGRLERAICDYTGARYAIGVNSGTDALTLLLRAASIGSGDEVIVPCFTFIASAASIANAGARPVFIDVDPATYTMDIEQVRQKIGPRTRAVMPVHLFCQMADMKPLLELANDAGICVIEDSAEGIGMRYDGTHAGLMGTGGVLSFFPTKTLGALGDAGMILTNDDEIAERVRCTRHHGRGGKTVGHMPGISHEALYCGTNSKMDDIQAAVLLMRLRYLDDAIEKREELARIYDRQLEGLAPHVQVPKYVCRAVESNPVYYTYLIEAEHKIELIQHLEANGVCIEDYYPRPIHLQPCFRHLGYGAGDFLVAERACTRTIALPLYPDLTQGAVEMVCKLISDFYFSVKS